MLYEALENTSFISNLSVDATTGNILVDTKFTWCQGISISLFVFVTPDCIVISDNGMLYKNVSNKKIFDNVNWPSEYLSIFHDGIISKEIRYSNKEEFLDELLEFINMLIRLDGIRMGLENDF